MGSRPVSEAAFQPAILPAGTQAPQRKTLLPPAFEILHGECAAIADGVSCAFGLLSQTEWECQTERMDPALRDSPIRHPGAGRYPVTRCGVFATTMRGRYWIPACAGMTSSKVAFAIPLTFPALGSPSYAFARSPDSRNRS
ncbi:hypothetical protein GCM10027021_12880 [Dyella kyungheensis]